MPIIHAIVLGLTQGLSEFLPISSSGHLILVPWLLGWDDFHGNDSLHKTFDVALHIGTFAGAVAYFRADVARYVRAAFGMLRGRDEDRAGGRSAWLLLFSAVPAAIVGAALDSQIETLDDKIWLVAVALLVFGLLLLWADRARGRRDVASFGVRDALVMGAAQTIALQPGASRSGVTISAGRFAGLGRDGAARLSFLMSLPIIAGAALFKLASVLAGDGIPSNLHGPFVVGIITSGITGWFAVWATLRVVRTRSFTPFVIYRVAMALAVFGLLASPFR